MVDWVMDPKKPVEKGQSLVILLLNIIPLAGIGTMLYGRILRGILELLSSFILVGWIFSILDGIQVYTKTIDGRTMFKPSAA